MALWPLRVKFDCPCQVISIPDQYTARRRPLQYNAKVEFIHGTSKVSDGDWSGDLTTEPRIIEFVAEQSGQRPELAAWSLLKHETEWLEADAGHHGLLGNADAIITQTPNLAIATRTADCVPVFITGQRTAALVHAGMAGVALEILPRIVTVLEERFGESAASLSTTVGPFICAKCYALSQGNEELLSKHLNAQPFIREEGGTRTFDLAAGLIEQARAAGISSFDVSAPCTHHDEGLFSSRHGHAERLLSYVMMVPGA